MNSTKSLAGLAITDPLVVYRSRVARGLLKHDDAQIRAAKHLQSLYYRVRDYKPPKKNEVQLRAVIRDLETKYRGNRYIEGYQPSWWRKASTKRASRNLVKVLTDKEELENARIPRGFLLNGEVGCGKSMLMDIFADSLPYASKGRWHYHNFMLWVYRQIDIIQKRRSVSNKYSNHSILAMENEMILFEIASTMISKNTVLMLDEFALPDIAAAKIIKMLFTWFFRLGGVLVATSNRLPEDLYATDFGKQEFQSFLEVLQMRCYTFDMSSNNDYRKILSSEGNDPRLVVKSTKNHQNQWDLLIEKVTEYKKGNVDVIIVYGRKVIVPWHHGGTVVFDFDYICRGIFGPADYISLASKYHTFVIDNVDVFKTSMKSEARRFITFIDALYECKCQLFIRTEADLDKLFFPDREESPNNVQQQEVFSKTQLDMISPYRPNVAEYDDGALSFDENQSPSAKTNYTNTNKFTGDDEKFAYKRAVSRIEEMTKSPQWRKLQWSPIPSDFRDWEQQSSSSENADKQDLLGIDNEGAPKFEDVHFWSVGAWGAGKRLKDELAKRWIKGAENN